MYSLPQEIEVWYIIPSIRREISRILAENHNLKQKEVAKLLGISESAISQYSSGKRAKEIRFPKEMKKDFETACRKIVKDKQNVVREMMKLVNLSKERGVSCCMCKKYNKGILKMCSCKPEKEILGGIK